MWSLQTLNILQRKKLIVTYLLLFCFVFYHINSNVRRPDSSGDLEVVCVFMDRISNNISQLLLKVMSPSKSLTDVFYETRFSLCPDVKPTGSHSKTWHTAGVNCLPPIHLERDRTQQSWSPLVSCPLSSLSFSMSLTFVEGVSRAKYWLNIFISEAHTKIKLNKVLWELFMLPLLSIFASSYWPRSKLL